MVLSTPAKSGVGITDVIPAVIEGCRHPSACLRTRTTTVASCVSSRSSAGILGLSHMEAFHPQVSDMKVLVTVPMVPEDHKDDPS